MRNLFGSLVLFVLTLATSAWAQTLDEPASPTEALAQGRPYQLKSADEFGQLLTNSGEVPIVIKFGAPWCSPCRELGKSIEKVAPLFKGKVIIVIADEDYNGLGELFYKLKDSSDFGIPQTYIYRNKLKVKSMAGSMNPKELRYFIRRGTKIRPAAR